MLLYVLRYPLFASIFQNDPCFEILILLARYNIFALRPPKIFEFLLDFVLLGHGSGEAEIAEFDATGGINKKISWL